MLPSQGRSGGILVPGGLGGVVVVKRTDYEVVELEHGDFFARCLTVNKMDGFKWNLVIIYGGSQLSGKEYFLREFVHLCSRSRFPSVYRGVFNLIRNNASEKNTSGGITKWNTIFSIII
jgi:hypothetical protein